LNDTFYMPVRRFQSAYVDAQMSRNRGSNLLRIQPRAFNFAALDNVGGKGSQNRLLPQLESESLHVPDQAALLVSNLAERLRQDGDIENKPGPIRPFMDE
jgi:hypothetical protein